MPSHHLFGICFHRFSGIECIRYAECLKATGLCGREKRLSTGANTPRRNLPSGLKTGQAARRPTIRFSISFIASRTPGRRQPRPRNTSKRKEPHTMTEPTDTPKPLDEGGVASVAHGSAKTYEYLCTECGGDAYYGLTNWIDSITGKILIGPKERLCAKCARPRQVEWSFHRQNPSANAERIHGDDGSGKPRETLPPLDGASC